MIIFTKQKATFLLALLSIFTIFVFLTPRPVHASYDPNNLIDNVIFRNKNAMSQSDIQNFLASKNSYLATYWTPRWNGSIALASQIIYEAAQSYDINPQVILATIQKEQSLVTNPHPLQSSLNCAMGYLSCGGYLGFGNQIDAGTWQLDHNYRAVSGIDPIGNFPCRFATSLYDTPLFPGNKVTFSNPGGLPRTITIANAATASLYCYTPHVGPYSETGYSGSYNFVISFEAWFGSTRAYINLDEPRWMELKQNVYKKNVITGENADIYLEKGRKLKFLTKIYVRNKLYLRTAYDTGNNIDSGILYDDLKEIEYMPFITPRYMKVTANTYKVRPSSGRIDYTQPITLDSNLKFTSKILIDGIWYYRTENDSSRNIDLAVFASRVGELNYSDFENPRYLEIKNDTKKVNPVTGALSIEGVVKNTHLFFDSKIYVGNKWYYRLTEDTINNSFYGIEAINTSNIEFEPIGNSPKWMQLNKDTSKVSTLTTSVLPNTHLVLGRHLLIADKININGTWYYRTVYDAENRLDRAIPSNDFREISFEPMIYPRYMLVNQNTQKVYPKTNVMDNMNLDKGLSLEFVSKINVGGRWYLRTKYDTERGIERAIYDHELSELVK